MCNSSIKSSSHVQVLAESKIFQQIQNELGTHLEKNQKVFLSSNMSIYMQPDFYSEEKCIVGEIFAHIGKPKKSQDNKIANDILKMLLLEKVKGKKYNKIIVVCDSDEEKKLKGTSVLAESIRRFGINVMCVVLDNETRSQIIAAQKLQRMTNAE